MKAYYITFNTTGLNRRPWPLSSHYSGTRDLFGISIDTIQEGGRWYMVVHPGGEAHAGRRWAGLKTKFQL